MPASLAQRLNHDARMGAAGEAGPVGVQLSSSAGGCAPGCADNNKHNVHCGRARHSTVATTATSNQRPVLTRCMHINALHAAAGLVARVKPLAGQQRGRPVAPLSAAAGATGSSSDSPNMGAVLTAVGVSCMGAFAFGYHLGVVNGPLEAIAKELGFAGNQALAGLVGLVLCTGSICTVSLLVSRPRLPAVHGRSRSQPRRSSTGTHVRSARGRCRQWVGRGPHRHCVHSKGGGSAGF